MPPLELEQIKQIEKMEKATGNDNALTMEQIDAYRLRQEQRTEGEAATQEDQEICQRLADMMLLDVQADSDLAQLLPEAHAQQEAEFNRLQMEANRSGTEKIKNDFLGQQRHAAQKRLAEITQKRQEVVEKRQNIAWTQREQQWATYRPAKERKLDPGRHLANPFRAICNTFGLGRHKQRHDGAEYKAVVNSTMEDVAIPTTAGLLVGKKYTPLTTPLSKPKLVIVYSGSGGSGASMITPMVEAYIKKGATVLHADYRGFGKSETRKKDKKVPTHLCEASIYEDGRAVYDYAKTTLGFDPGDILLHGFSLGGAVASKVAADVAEENAQRMGKGESIHEQERLGGLVLNSAIASMSEAASQTIAGSGTIAWLGSGAYNTRSHMRRLHRFDPALPVHYRGGSPDTDQLSLDLTKLQEDKQATFLNSNAMSKNNSHMHGNMDGALWAIQAMLLEGRAARIGK